MEPAKRKSDSDLSSPVPRKQNKTLPPKETIIRQLEEEYLPTEDPEVQFLYAIKPEVQIIEAGSCADFPVEIEPEETFVHPPQPFIHWNLDGTVLVGHKYYTWIRQFQESDELCNL